MKEKKYVNSLKIIKLSGFELVVGGDIAALKKSREIKRVNLIKKMKEIKLIHNSFKKRVRNGENFDSLIGNDFHKDVKKKVYFINYRLI